jgi:ribosomal protein L15
MTTSATSPLLRFVSLYYPQRGGGRGAAVGARGGRGSEGRGGRGGKGTDEMVFENNMMDL